MNLRATVPALIGRAAKDKRGNVLMIMGFALIPITMAAGMTVDYTRAARLKTKLDAAADAAVLSAVAQAATGANDKAVCERAAALFDSQASGIDAIGYNKRTNVTVTVGTAATPSNVSYNGVTDACTSPIGNASSATARIVSLNYTVESNNFFGGILKKLTTTVSGRAGSEVSIAPDIDFYVALDTSPSMALPVTDAGITALTSTVSCTFACHTNNASNTIQDNGTFALNKLVGAGTGTVNGNPVTYIDGNNTYVYTNRQKCTTSGGRTTCVADTNVYNSDGSYVDTYWYAKNKNIVLRIDELRRATSDLVSVALTEASTNGATYQAAIYGFDYEENFRRIQPLVKIAEKFPTATTLSNGVTFRGVANSTAVELAMLDDKRGNGCPATNCRSDNRYLFTSFKGLLDGMAANGVLPATAGNGTRTAGDTPQTYLFIVTDGMSDEKASVVGGVNSLGSDRTRSEITASGTNNHISKCNALKARNIRIAVLYTQYTAASIASDEVNQRTYVTNRISPTDLVEQRLRDCASPGLMSTVTPTSDISAALTALFRKAIAAPRLVR